MDRLFLAAFAWFAGAPAYGVVMWPGDSVIGTNYQLSASEFSSVGTTSNGFELLQVTFSVTNVTGNADFDAVAISSESVIGSNGVLHHDQAIFGLVPTPTLDSIVAFGQPGSAVDSHYLPPVVLPSPGGAPVEDALSELGAADTGINSVFPPIPPFKPAGITGFGPAIRGGYAFGAAARPTGTTIPIAQVVFAPGRGLDVDFSIVIVDASPLTPSERFEGILLMPLPEPATAMLAAIGLAITAATRRRPDSV